MTALRRLALQGTELTNTTAGTIRLKLLKLGALVTVSVRRIKVAIATACPMKTVLPWRISDYALPPDAACRTRTSTTGGYSAEPDQRCIRGEVGLAPINALPSPTTPESRRRPENQCREICGLGARGRRALVKSDLARGGVGLRGFGKLVRQSDLGALWLTIGASTLSERSICRQSGFIVQSVLDLYEFIGGAYARRQIPR